MENWQNNIYRINIHCYYVYKIAIKIWSLLIVEKRSNKPTYKQTDNINVSKVSD